MNFSGTVRKKCSRLIKRDSHQKQQDPDKQITGKDDIFSPVVIPFQNQKPVVEKISGQQQAGPDIELAHAVFK